ncbi:hypothetical protein MIMGU_mgv11b0163502mg, partial [Erythranthe guttata]
MPSQHRQERVPTAAVPPPHADTFIRRSTHHQAPAHRQTKNRLLVSPENAAVEHEVLIPLPEAHQPVGGPR